MNKYEQHDYDVVVVGAGGAGLRAAIESSARGARTALVCKSLLGKAHTVMAEGGVAAALASADAQDRGVHQGIDVFMECTLRSLLKDGGRIAGGFGYRRETGRFVVFRARAVVLATGGIGRCWEVSSNSWEYTADGHAMALWAGADLIDMEFVQFHPTGMVWPPSVRGTLITEGVRGEGGVLLNGKRERFMFHYVPEMFKGEFAETEEEANKWMAQVIAGERPTA